jgi:hypothetical protein
VRIHTAPQTARVTECAIPHLVHAYALLSGKELVAPLLFWTVQTTARMRGTATQSLETAHAMLVVFWQIALKFSAHLLTVPIMVSATSQPEIALATQTGRESSAACSTLLAPITAAEIMDNAIHQLEAVSVNKVGVVRIAVLVFAILPAGTRRAYVIR